MSVNTSETNEFGKDLGLLHKVVVAGRKVGMDHALWSVLADRSDILEGVADLARRALRISCGDLADISLWITRSAGVETLDGEKNYNCADEHSKYCERFQSCHEAMRNIFWRAQHNEEARKLCKEIEILFLLSYLHVAIHVALEQFSLRSSDRACGYSHPINGFYITLNHSSHGDDRVRQGYFLTRDEFRANEAVLAVYNQAYVNNADFDAHGYGMFRGEEFREHTVRQMHDITRAARDNQKQKISQLVDAIGASIEERK